MTFKAFCNRYHVLAECELVEKNPNMAEWADATHWKVRLHRKNPRHTLTTYYSMGYALTGEPEAHEVLECLTLDARGFGFARTFQDWCGEYGYSDDSIKAENLYRTIEHQSGKLQAFAGDEWDDLMRCEE